MNAITHVNLSLLPRHIVRGAVFLLVFATLSFAAAKLAQSRSVHNATAEPHVAAVRIIVKPNEQPIANVLNALKRLSGTAPTVVRAMSGEAFVISWSGKHSPDSVDRWISLLLNQGLIRYGQIDSRVNVNTGLDSYFAGLDPVWFRDTAPATVMPDELALKDQYFEQQWIFASPDIYAASVNMAKAWEITTGSDEVIVAVIDTGILFDHSDLTNRLLQGYDFVSGINDAPETVIPVHNADNYLKSHDGDGRDLDPTDPGDGVDLAFQEYMSSLGYDCPLLHSTWHGTAMASLLAANGNDGLGMAGVDWNAHILPVRAIGRCGGNRSDLLDAIRWAAGVEDPNLPPNPAPARIINLSLGIDDACGPADQQAINDAVRAGAIIVAAVGNQGRNTDQRPSAPADCRHVIGVSAVNADGSRANYSNYGDDADIAAPGGDIAGGNERKVLVATNDGTTQSVPGSTHRFTTGTSVATPLVSGVLSLMLSVNPALTNTQLEELLYRSSRPFIGSGANPCDPNSCGAGLLDAYQAVVAARGAIDNPPQIAAATISDNFLVTTTSGHFGCAIANTSGNIDISFIALLSGLALLYMNRRQVRRKVRIIVADNFTQKSSRITTTR